MSVHEQFAEDLALYALGTLSEDERFALEKHLEMCGSCRRELEVMRGDLAVVALSTSGPKPPARSRERLMAARAFRLAGSFSSHLSSRMAALPPGEPIARWASRG